MYPHQTLSIEATALIFHHMTDSNRTGHLTVTTHPIHHVDGRPELGAGTNFSTQDKAHLAQLLLDDLSTELALLDAHVLATSLETLIWYHPRSRVRLCFAKSGWVEVPLPSLIFRCHRGSLSVVAYKGERRPTAETPVFQAPFPNLFSGGQLCLGGNRLPAFPRPKDRSKLERFFLESPFTDHGATIVLKDQEGSIEEFWQGLSEVNAKRFPTSRLQAMSGYRTLGDWMGGNER